MKYAKRVMVITVSLLSIASYAEAAGANCTALLQIAAGHEANHRYFGLLDFINKTTKAQARLLFANSKSRLFRLLLTGHYPALAANPDQFFSDNLSCIAKSDPEEGIVAAALHKKNPPTPVILDLLQHSRDLLTRASAEIDFPLAPQFTAESHNKALRALGYPTLNPSKGYNPPFNEAEWKKAITRWSGKVRAIVQHALRTPTAAIEISIPEDLRSEPAISGTLEWIFELRAFHRIKIVWVPERIARTPDLSTHAMRHSPSAALDWNQMPDFGSAAYTDRQPSEEEFLIECAIAFVIVFGDKSDLRLVKGLVESKFSSLYELYWWRLRRNRPGF